MKTYICLKNNRVSMSKTIKYLAQNLYYSSYNIKPIEKLSRRHFKNSFDVFEVLGSIVLTFLLWHATR